MADVAEHHAALYAMKDQADVAACARRPEVLVFDIFQPVALQPWGGRVHLQFKSCHLGNFLLIAAQAITAPLKAICKQKLHQATR